MVIKITFVTKVLLYRSVKSFKAFVLQWDIEEHYVFVNSDVRRTVSIMILLIYETCIVCYMT